MDLLEAVHIARNLMRKHNLQHWSFGFNKNRRRLGVCKQHSRSIELSEHYVLHNAPETVIDTILHEIAHALVGTKHGHNQIWKGMCQKIGCRPSASVRTVNMPDGRWQARCPSCNLLFSRHRQPRSLAGRYCKRCGPQRGSLLYVDTRLSADGLI